MLADSRSIHTRRFLSELRRQNCRVLLASLERGSTPHYRLSRLGPPPMHYFLAVPQLRRLVKRFQPDIINAHYASGYGTLVSFLSSDMYRRTVVNLWGSDILLVPHKSVFHRWKTKRALAAADLVIADSQYLKCKAVEIQRPIRSSVIPWGIEESALEFARLDRTFKRPLRIIAPRLHEGIYNNEFILESLRSLIERGEVEITFSSAGKRFALFKKRVSALIGKGVNLYAPMNRIGFLRFMAEHDVYLSNAAHDSSPVSLIEAMALGLIPIVSEVPGIDEWINSQRGYLFPGTDSDRLRSIVSSLLSSDIDFNSWRRANHEIVKERGIFEKNISIHIDVIKLVLKTTPRGRTIK